MSEWAVYEEYGKDGWSFIGTVEAETLNEAQTIAGRKFGAPIKVEKE